MTIVNADSLAERAVSGLHAHLIEWIARKADLTTSVLDVGCGTGVWARRLLDAGVPKVVGIDIDPPKIIPGRFEVHQRDLNKHGWNRGLGRFKLVTSIEVIEHISNSFEYLCGLRDSLEPEGMAVISTPNVHAIRVRLKYLLTNRLKQFDREGDQTHVFPIFLYPFARACERVGLQLDARWTFPEQGALTVGIGGRLASMLGTVLRDELPGDSLCFVLSRKSYDKPG